ncbi:PDZ domain-containing protein [Paenibacillus psychroresistens]|uniref:PDZ domain-containing protein n=1 Tax=Paenibacillus psychroresistens TaxID=1778678 RepID=A0A6B8RHP3_9BACL|nr:trypsin-like peptidase domain-containing protein [Paenibacillus psychroresistens]QGQ94878.1 PDZ domain-containing protein [Paenibacillus psychroresistens]
MFSNRVRKAVGLFSIILLISSTTATAASSSTSNTVPLSTKKIEGEVYFKASDLLKALGGELILDEKTKAYSYKKPNPVPDAIAKVSPAVVGIIGKPDETESADSDNRFSLAHGTGVIIKADGWIVTNAHVVKNMKNLTVVTTNGKQYAAKTMNIDEESDLALVKISATGLPIAKFADKLNVQVGETVVAIGTPISFSLRNSVSVGVISGIDRSIHSTYRLLQTDAAINPGNSGGPLINLKGEVVGINSLKFAAVGVDSLGFSIPIDTVNYVIQQFFKYGKVKRPYSGLELEESWAAVVGLPTTDPLTVVNVATGSPAGIAGIKKGDVIYSLDAINVTTLIDFNEQLRKYLPGDKTKLMVLSDGDLKTISLTFTEQK